MNLQNDFELFDFDRWNTAVTKEEKKYGNYKSTDTSQFFGGVSIKEDDLKFIVKRLKEMKPNLIEFGLSGNRSKYKINSIEPLGELVNLIHLDLRENKITSFEALNGLVNLKHLYLGHNCITSDHLKLIGEHFPNLVDLDLRWNKITSVEALRKLIHLTTLYLQGNQITSIEGLSGLVNLRTLNFAKNHITNIEALAGMVNLTSLVTQEEDNIVFTYVHGKFNQITKESKNKFLTQMGIMLMVSMNDIDELPSHFQNVGRSNSTLSRLFKKVKVKFDWTTIAANIEQLIQRFPKHFSKNFKDKDKNLPLSIVCGFDPTKIDQHKFIAYSKDPDNIQAHLTVCQLIYDATSPTATDNLDRDRKIIATTAINPEVRKWAKELNTYITRYRIDEGPPIHQSATCRVVFAEDLFYVNAQTGETKVQTSETKVQTSETKVQTRETKNMDDTNKKRVALKIMKNHNEFKREITTRYGTDSEDLSDCTIGIIGWHIPDDVSRIPDSQLRSVKERPERPTEKEYVLVMELGSASLFLEMVSQRIAGHDVSKIINIFCTVVERVQQLHSHKLTHSDIKPRNILHMPNGTILLCDLDAALLTGTVRDESFKCSSAYCPPELARFLFANGSPPIVTDKFDVWSLGVVLYELCTGQHLFSQDISDDNMTAAIDQTRLCTWNTISDEEMNDVFLYHFEDDVIKAAKHLIRWCLKGNSKDRPSIQQILDHPFLVKDKNFDQWLIDHPLLQLPMIYSTFLSHTQIDSSGVVGTLYHEYRRLGMHSWLDMHMEDLTIPGMIEGIKNSNCFLLVLTERVLDSWYCQLEINKAIELKKPIQILLDSDYRLGRPFGKWNWQEGGAFKELKENGFSYENAEGKKVVDKNFATTLLTLLKKAMPHAIVYRRREFEAKAMMRALCARRGVDAMNNTVIPDLALDLPTEKLATKVRKIPPYPELQEGNKLKVLVIRRYDTNDYKNPIYESVKVELEKDGRLLFTDDAKDCFDANVVLWILTGGVLKEGSRSLKLAHQVLDAEENYANKSKREQTLDRIVTLYDDDSWSFGSDEHNKFPRIKNSINSHEGMEYRTKSEGASRHEFTSMIDELLVRFGLQPRRYPFDDTVITPAVSGMGNGKRSEDEEKSNDENEKQLEITGVEAQLKKIDENVQRKKKQIVQIKQSLVRKLTPKEEQEEKVKEAKDKYREMQDRVEQENTAALRKEEEVLLANYTNEREKLLSML